MNISNAKVNRENEKLCSILFLSEIFVFLFLRINSNSQFFSGVYSDMYSSTMSIPNCLQDPL